MTLAILSWHSSPIQSYSDVICGRLWSIMVDRTLINPLENNYIPHEYFVTFGLLAQCKSCIYTGNPVFFYKPLFHIVSVKCHSFRWLLILSWHCLFWIIIFLVGVVISLRVVDRVFVKLVFNFSYLLFYYYFYYFVGPKLIYFSLFVFHPGTCTAGLECLYVFLANWFFRDRT